MENGGGEFTEELRAVWQRLHEFCSACDWRGYDPYDGLTSPWARLLPGKTARQAWTQFHRRNPINFRRLCGIEPQLNSTTVALFALGSGDARLLDLLAMRIRRPPRSCCALITTRNYLMPSGLWERMTAAPALVCCWN